MPELAVACICVSARSRTLLILTRTTDAKPFLAQISALTNGYYGILLLCRFIDLLEEDPDKSSKNSRIEETWHIVVVHIAANTPQCKLALCRFRLDLIMQ